MMHDNITSVKQARSLVWLIWGAMLASLVMGTVALVLWGTPIPVKAMESGAPFYLEFVAFGFAILSLILRRTLLGEFRHGDWTLETTGGARRLIVGNVVCFALAVTIGIIGLALGSLGYGPDLFLLEAFALLLWHVPLAFRFRRRT